MRGLRNERRPRGKYARLICQRCRSRKIKCVLPNPEQIELSGAPQGPDHACDRCRNFNLECIVERTMLGRPAAVNRGRRSGSAVVDGVGDADAEQPLDIKEYMWSGDAEEPLQIKHHHHQGPAAKSKHPSKQDVFESIIDPACFLSLILANNPVFGSNIVHSTTPWGGFLPDLIDDDLAESLDRRLAWHRFFLPQTPSLISVRHRLLSNDSASHTPATNLLFALLCSMALETPECASEHYSQLISSVQLAVSSYGQDFIFSPPIHRDSVIISLLLSDYRPTAIVSSQSVAHKAVKSDLYVNIAYRIAERLEMLSDKPRLDFNLVNSINSLELEAELIDSLQTLQLYSYDALTSGYIATPVMGMLQLLDRMRPYIALYEHVLKIRPCSPRLIYHIQYAISNYTMIEVMARMKQSWDSWDNLAAVMEDGKNKCLEHIESCNRCLATSLNHYFSPEEGELSAATRALLEFRFKWVSMKISGAGLLYAMVLQTRARGSPAKNGPEISCQEGVQIGTQAIDNLISIQRGQIADFSSFLGRFALKYPGEMKSVLDSFLDCGSRLKIDGVAFHPPPRRVVLEIVILCKNIVENMVVFLKSFSRLPPFLPERLEMLATCERQLDAMVAAPWTSTNSAFASGCIYAASSKLIHRLRDFMNNLQSRVSRREEQQRQQQEQQQQQQMQQHQLLMPQQPLHEDQASIFDLHSNSDGHDSGLDASFEGWDSWPHFGGFDMFTTSDDNFDWSLAWDMFFDCDPMNMNTAMNPMNTNPPFN
ncbi:uncharacterized protein TRUGW13939_08898 [Talaromyces rugulosus]|uniref:Zn(2)-C6 fungal-type domain-containing protein n=1 Tax=Talaromyces rugulosus TaxID=121627 RepID=A0A7H8R5T7_TALRU|nr:uncharacterized protein TRUGW13939_08898 [Talaromyces rugulosus]QKX61742.1 hypothetical protein TRUGW13939_08898 [Talaromyces rugulosus]